MFEDFNFRLLDSPEFKEDSVREELITPILHKLGYRAGGDFQIIRSKALTHPFVLIGTVERKIIITPDYLMQVYEDFAWILDAKHPNQNITNGKNVEQAYSYAIHPDVRVKLYALCNGHELTVFHINQIKPVIQIDLIDIRESWDAIENILSPQKVLKYKLRPKDKDLYPDYGLYLFKLGYSNQEQIEWVFYEVPIIKIDRVDYQTFSIFASFSENGITFAASFDFNIEKLDSLINLANEDQGNIILDGLNRQPFQADSFGQLTVNIGCRLGLPTQSKYEDIVPMIVTQFF
jgi:hypothetical protein